MVGASQMKEKGHLNVVTFTHQSFITTLSKLRAFPTNFVKIFAAVNLRW